MSTRKMSFNVSESAYADLQSLSALSHRSMTELFRVGIGLAKLAFEAQDAGQVLLVAEKDGRAVKEVVLP